ncbi:MAG: sigma-54-dependent Fis family transcriptional regulator [Deltaproteobacteria bacterium]|nr:sigma-54-dependent Fis family transcriptional regulator [Deltaproteobacteria bacterium]
MTATTTLDSSTAHERDASVRESDVAALVLVWSATDPARVGELLAPRGDGEPAVFGRGAAEGSEPRAELIRQRPGRDEPTEPLDNPFLSRRHLVIAAEAGGVAIENLGKKALLHDGEPADSELVVRAGETIEIPGQAIFLCVDRPRALPATHVAIGMFGEPDAYGIVGESAAAWELRDQCARIGALSAHVLVLGESGTGKELGAQAIHAQSARAGKKLVARNAATFPSGLIDAELFGNVASYPNAGMPERRGVIGEADGSTLFLDEIAEMPQELQSHLLRVLDAGEYSRLGEAQRRHADLRVVAATNRGPDALKHDLAARLVLRLTMPSLNARREDIPLIARHLLRRHAKKDAPIAMRFFGGNEPRLSPALVRALVSHRYTTNVRELDSFLLRALVTSRGSSLELTDDIAGEIVRAHKPRLATQPFTAEQIRASLDKHAGVREKVWRELGMANRYVLKRLMKKYGIADDP